MGVKSVNRFICYFDYIYRKGNDSECGIVGWVKNIFQFVLSAERMTAVGRSFAGRDLFQSTFPVRE